jgi:hypothetical protein
MYIGRQPIIGNFIKLDAITATATTTFNLLNGGVAYYPQSANNCLVSLNGILQAPTDSYTISGSTIVFSSALTTSDVIDFIIVLGDVLNIGTPSDNTVTAAKIVNGTIGLSKLSATGTKDSTTFLRGDNTFATVSAGFTIGTPTATTSGSTVTYTGIPSGTKMIIFNLSGVSDTGSSHQRFQIGSGSLETSGYVSTSGNFEGGGGGTMSDTSGFGLKNDFSGRITSGQAFFTLQDSSTNTWVYSFIGKHDGTLVLFAGGNKSISGTLDRISFQSVSSSFDAGSVNIMYI